LRGTGGPDEGPGAPGLREAAGVWEAEERKEDITLRELKAVSLVLGRGLGVDVQTVDVTKGDLARRRRLGLSSVWRPSGSHAQGHDGRVGRGLGPGPGVV
jgi:hypothetical protein